MINWQLKKTACKSRYIITLIFLFFYVIASGQKAELIKSRELFQMLEQCTDKNKIEVYNFWATWCAPCIREIPQFEAVNKLYEEVNITLISLDDADELNNQVKMFITKRKVDSKVVLLDETDFNEIINRVDTNWSGAIPATLIVDCRNGERIFYEGEFKENELHDTIEKLLNSP